MPRILWRVAVVAGFSNRRARRGGCQVSICRKTRRKIVKKPPCTGAIPRTSFVRCPQLQPVLAWPVTCIVADGIGIDRNTLQS
ncbi:MAG: hypothetical protein AMJ66_02390 [Betaproteobacteria bacterium SG8_40]|nr:MAG: hypothetical protein AMJ66_02390 [Betaproteobacteria bacterium SG8_40]